MRNMTVTHLLEITLRFERGKKAGLGLRRRILQAFSLARGAPSGWFIRSKINAVARERFCHETEWGK